MITPGSESKEQRDHMGPVGGQSKENGGGIGLQRDLLPVDQAVTAQFDVLEKVIKRRGTDLQLRIDAMNEGLHDNMGLLKREPAVHFAALLSPDLQHQLVNDLHKGKRGSPMQLMCIFTYMHRWCTFFVFCVPNVHLAG